MAKNKYDPNTFPLLVEGMARDGMFDKDIWKALNVSKQTFYTYLKTYVDFFDALKRGRAPVSTRVENNLLKRADGYEFIETHTKEELAPDGKTMIVTEVKTVTKQMAPDVGAIAFWLKNKKPESWKDKRDLDVNVNNPIGALFEEEAKENGEDE